MPEGGLCLTVVSLGVGDSGGDVVTWCVCVCVCVCVCMSVCVFVCVCV